MAIKEISAIDEVSAAKAFIDEHAKGEDGKKTITKTEYYAFMQSEGHKRDVVDGVAEANIKLLGGTMLSAADALKADIAAAKEAGDDPTNLSTTIVIPTPMGRNKVVVSAQKTFRNPTTGEPTVQYGVSNLSIQTKSVLPGHVADHIRSEIEGLMDK